MRGACSASSRRKSSASSSSASARKCRSSAISRGARARDGSDRLRKVDDALLAHRSHQPQAQRARHHDRGSDRVRAREQAVHHHAASGGRAHRLVQDGAARGAARGSGHRARGRAARSGDGVDRDRDGGDGTPRVRDAAHDVGGRHDRSPHRSVPARPAGAGARDVVGVAARRDLADAVQEDRRRPRRGARGAALDSVDREPHSRGEDLPDRVGDSDVEALGHGHAQRCADRSGGRRAGRAEGSVHEGERQDGLRAHAAQSRHRSELPRPHGGAAGGASGAWQAGARGEGESRARARRARRRDRRRSRSSLE